MKILLNHYKTVRKLESEGKWSPEASTRHQTGSLNAGQPKSAMIE